MPIQLMAQVRPEDITVHVPSPVGFAHGEPQQFHWPLTDPQGHMIHIICTIAEGRELVAAMGEALATAERDHVVDLMSAPTRGTQVLSR